MKPYSIILFFIFYSFSIISLTGQNTTCTDPTPFSNSFGIPLPANSDGTGNGQGPQASAVNPNNDYGCLGTTGNPAWFYGVVSSPGAIEITISNTANLDLDFIIYGPYPGLPTALQDCNGSGSSSFNNGHGNPASEIADCSYLTDATETVNIAVANIGDVYILLITNYANLPTDIILQQTNGDGAFESSQECFADTGTHTVATSGTFQENEISLCVGDDFSIISNNDYTLPPSATGQTAELLFAIYNSLPPSNPDPLSDAGFSGSYWATESIVSNSSLSTNDSGGLPSTLTSSGVTGTNGTTVWYVPVTADDGDNNGNPNNSINIDLNGDNCYDVGTPFRVNYFLDIVLLPFTTCNSTTGFGAINFQVSGGAPAIDSSNFIVTNCGDGTLSMDTIPNNGNFILQELVDGNTACITVTDAQGCTQSFNELFSCYNSLCQSDSALTVVGENPSCPGVSDGAISLTVMEGYNPPLSFDWDYDGIGDFNDPQNPSGLLAGTYHVTVIDADNCAADTSVTITGPSYNTATITGPPSVCPETIANITVSFSGNETEPYTIYVNGQAYENIANAFSFPVSPPGTYTLESAINLSTNCSLNVNTILDISIMDTEAPAFIDPPIDTSYVCPEDVPPMPALQYTDNCQGSGTVDGTETISGNTIVRKWVVFDAFSNDITHKQIITLIATNCTACPDTLMLYHVLPSQLYQSAELIISNGSILSDSLVDFRAGNCILMDPDFEVQLGAEFEAKIDTCQ